jgi:hypothetical protein
VVDISFVCAKWWCKEGRVYARIARIEICGEQGDLLLGTTWDKRGFLELNDHNCSSGETSVDMYKLEEAVVKSCSDILAMHQRKCTHDRMKIL